MDGSRKHYIEWANPDPERQISYVLPHKWLLDIKERKPDYNLHSKETRCINNQGIVVPLF